MRRVAVALVLLLASPLVAQEHEPVLEPGDRVRVRLANLETPIVGTFLGFTGQQLVSIDPEKKSDPKYFSLPSVQSVEIRGEESHTGRGLIIGGVVGGLSGALGGVLAAALAGGGCAVVSAFGAFDEVSDSSSDPCDVPTGEYAAIGAGIGLLAGGGIGALIGSVPREGWVPAQLPPAKPMVAVHATGCFSVGVSIPLRR